MGLRDKLSIEIRMVLYINSLADHSRNLSVYRTQENKYICLISVFLSEDLGNPKLYVMAVFIHSVFTQVTLVHAHSWIGDVFHRPMYDKSQSQSSLYTPAHCNGILLFTGFKNWLTFLLGLNMVFMEALLKMLPMLSVTPFIYGRSACEVSEEHEKLCKVKVEIRILKLHAITNTNSCKIIWKDAKMWPLTLLLLKMWL